MTVRRYSIFGISGLVVLAVLILGLRLWLPYFVRDYLNDQLADLGDYTGHLSDVDLHLWRGAYSINNLIIKKSTGKVPVPLLDAPHIGLSVDWHELLRGSVAAEVDFDRPQLNFVDDASKSEAQNGGGVDWRKELEGLVPIKLNQVNINDGTIAFRAFDTKPPVDLKATHFNAVVTNLTNVGGAGGKRVAKFSAKADLPGKAPLETHASFDPLGKLDDFAFDLKVLSMQLPQINSLLQAYARIDVASGTGDFVMELEAKGGVVNGYAKPIFHDLNILDWKQDVEKQRDNPFRLLWEGITGLATTLFQNHSKEQFATRIPISGDLKDPQIGRWEALLAILSNAFGEAFKAQLEKGKPG